MKKTLSDGDLLLKEDFFYFNYYYYYHLREIIQMELRRKRHIYRSK